MNKAILALFLLLAVGLVFAAEKETKEPKALSNETNMTYGQCVSDAAGVKNECYATIKATRTSCIETAKNTSSDDKTCKADYKKELKACKQDFKMAKADCAKIYKPGFFEKMKASFK